MIDIETELNTMLKRRISIIEAAQTIAEKHNIEIESVASIISKNSKMKSIIHDEASELNLLKEKKNKFPEGL